MRPTASCPGPCKMAPSQPNRPARNDSFAAPALREGPPRRALAGWATFVDQLIRRILKRNHAERPGEIVVGTSGEVKPVRGAVRRRSSAKLDAPDLVDVNHVALGVFQRADELPGDGVESVDGAA